MWERRRMRGRILGKVFPPHLLKLSEVDVTLCLVLID
jgi:hypothetical protein